MGAWAGYITPLNSGAGPMTMYTMRRSGVPLPVAVTSTFMSFVATILFFAIAGPLALLLAVIALGTGLLCAGCGGGAAPGGGPAPGGRRSMPEHYFSADPTAPFERETFTARSEPSAIHTFAPSKRLLPDNASPSGSLSPVMKMSGRPSPS